MPRWLRAGVVRPLAGRLWMRAVYRALTHPLVAIAIFALTTSLNPALGLTGIILTAAFYGAMLVCAMTVGSVKDRNLAFTWLLGAMSVSSTLLLLFVLITEQLS
jgi:hypothetical protein